MPKSAQLRLADLRAIYELVQECRDLADDHARWHAHWLHGLSRLTGAEFVVGGEAAALPGGVVQAVNTVVWGWENGFSRGAFFKVLADTDAEVSVSPLIAAYFRRSAGTDGAGVTRTDLFTDGEWYRTPYYDRIQRAIGIDHSLISFRALPGTAGRVNSLCLTRGTGARRDFGLRDRLIAAEAQRLITPLIGGPLARFQEPCPSELTPRVRQVLACLLEGDSDKQIAARLRISVFTVNQYVKTIFRHFGVTTRPELLARWVKRGWGRGGW